MGQFVFDTGGEALKAYHGLNNYGGFIASGGGDVDYPKAFVTILLFDKDHNLLDASWEQIDGGEQVGAAPKAAHDYMSQEVTVKEPGYAYVFISNESPTLVEFYVDDVTVTHTPTNVIQYNEYYPFGLQTSNSWTRSGSKNDYLYNSGTELNAAAGWYETMFRGYDAALGRFLQVDALAAGYADWTPYAYANNNPVRFNDPTRLSAEDDYEVEEIRRWMNRYGGPYWSAGGANEHDDFFVEIGGSGPPIIYNRWCPCFVSALDILSYRGEGQIKALRAMAQAAVDEWLSQQTQGGNSGDWFKGFKDWVTSHLYSEASLTVSAGPQVAFSPAPKVGVVPVFLRGAPLSIKVNAGSLILFKEQYDTENGHTATAWTDMDVTQGLGLSILGISGEINRTIVNGNAQDVLTGTLFGVGVERNLTTGQWSVGLLPSASMIFGLGVEAGAKVVLRFPNN